MGGGSQKARKRLSMPVGAIPCLQHGLAQRFRPGTVLVVGYRDSKIFAYFSMSLGDLDWLGERSAERGLRDACQSRKPNLAELVCSHEILDLLKHDIDEHAFIIAYCINEISAARHPQPRLRRIRDGVRLAAATAADEQQGCPRG